MFASFGACAESDGRCGLVLATWFILGWTSASEFVAPSCTRVERHRRTQRGVAQAPRLRVSSNKVSIQRSCRVTVGGHIGDSNRWSRAHVQHDVRRVFALGAARFGPFGVRPALSPSKLALGVGEAIPARAGVVGEGVSHRRGGLQDAVRVVCDPSRATDEAEPESGESLAMGRWSS